MKYFFILLAVLSCSAFAECDINPPVILNPPVLDVSNIPEDKWEAGTQLSAPAIVSSWYPYSHCDGAGGPSLKLMLSSPLEDSGVDLSTEYGNFDVFESGVPGIGYALGVRLTGQEQATPVQAGKEVTMQGGAGAGVSSLKVDVLIWYVSTAGFESGAYNIPQKVIAKVRLTTFNGCQFLGFNWCTENEVMIGSNVVELEVLACELLESQTSVDMGVISASKYLVGVGEVGPTVDFNIPIDCNGEVGVGLTIDSASARDAENGILSLTQGGAVGVGIQVLSQGNALPLGKESLVLPRTVEGRNNISLGARYIQVAEEVVPGKANSLVNFILKYR